MKPLALNGIKAAYARQLGEVEQLERDIRRAKRDLLKIEQAIYLFDPAWSGSQEVPIRPVRPSRWGRRGRGTKTALEVLRASELPLTLNEIVIAVLQKLAMPIPPYAEQRRIMASFSWSLRRHIGKGVIRIEGKPNRWTVER